MMLGPSTILFKLPSVTITAISIMLFVSIFSPVISISIQIKGSIKSLANFFYSIKN